MRAGHRRPWSVFVAFASILGGVLVAIDRHPVVAQSPSYQVQLSPQDTYLNIDTTNYSSDTELKSYTWPDNRVANAILMKFDLSGLPAGAAVQQATLRLALVETDATADTTYTITANKVTHKNPAIASATGYTINGSTAWTANTCCYNGVPLAQGDISAPYDTQAIDKTPGDKTWTITSMVQEWLASPSTNFGVLLNSDASRLRDRYRYFASMEYADATRRPYLSLTYTLPAVDTTPPSVSIGAPAAGATVSGTVSVAANASDNVGVASVQFKVDGVNLGPADTTAPFAVNWDTTALADGSHSLTAVARDAAGNVATAAAVVVGVANNAVRLAPQDTSLNINTTNYSTAATLTTYTWPDNRVANAILMKFDLSSLPAGATVQQATLKLALVQSDATADATYTITANKLTNSWVPGAATGYTRDGTIAWTANACCYNGVPLAQADISSAYDTQAIDKTPGYKTWTITSMVQEWLASPSTNFGVLLNSDASKLRDRYRFFASAEYSDATLRPYLYVKYALPASDTTAPTVAITAPAAGATVSGTLTVTANASDNVGVAGLQFKLDGANLGAEDLGSPYAATWNTTTAANGSHTLTAVARDAAGNTATAASVVVTVSNDTTPPVLSAIAASSITQSGATIGWTTDEASDSQVDYGTTASYGASSAMNATRATSHSIALGGLTSTTLYHFRVKSRDAAGNLAVSGDFTFTTLGATGTGIAARYPGDVGIETDSNVLFVERFDEGSLNNLFVRWTDILNGTAMSFSTDVPAGSPGPSSLVIPWIGGGASTGGHLYKLLTPGVDDTLYLRYYIKYPTTANYTHSGVWMGGYNPPLSWPDPQASVKPTGTDRFSGSAEPSNATGLFDHYDYWMGMHKSLDNNYWGNLLLNNPNVKATPDQWMCVEHMIKLNNPVTATNGERAIWLNGAQISHLGAGFPNGTWNGGIFTQDPSGSPFPGFQWRSDPALDLNGIWLQNYSPDTSAGGRVDMKFAHLVVAKSYIGCLAASSTDTAPPAVSITAPAAGSTVSGSTVTVTANATDDVGVVGLQFKLDGVNLGAEVTGGGTSITWDTTQASNGAHTLTAVARDAAGNSTTSAAVGVTVSNATTAAAWPNEPSGFVTITDQPWNATVGSGWNRRSPGTDQIVSDPAAPLSPTNVLEYIYPVGWVDGAAPATQYYPLSTKEVFVGMWWKPSNPWQGDASFVNKIQFLQVLHSSVFMGMYGPNGGPYELRADVQWPEQCCAWLTPNVNSGVVTLGQWHRLEWYLKYESSYGAGDGIIRWWLDGALVGNYTNVKYPNDGGFVEYQISPTWGGNTGDVKKEQDSYRFDHSYLSKPR